MNALDRSARLFKFLQALDGGRNNPPLHLKDYSWHFRLDSLPIHPEIEFTGYSSDGSDFVLRVGRPRTKDPPMPPSVLRDWINPGFDNPFKEPSHLESREQEYNPYKTEIYFYEDIQRVEAWKVWLTRWQEWARAERPTRQALKVFEEFYQLKGQLDREGDRLEIVIGNGILSWKHDGTSLYHPVLLQRVQLEFYADKPEFRIVETDLPSELYTPAIRAISNNQNTDVELVRKVEAASYLPLDLETNAFYKYLINLLSSKGTFTEGFPEENPEAPVIGQAPLLLLRSRNRGFSEAISKVLEVLPKRIEALVPLQRVVGVEAGSTPSFSTSRQHSWAVEQEVLLSKPANPEQLLVMSNVQKHPGVVVQGPPGTGKTHTIANLIGQLLTEGKSVLVTAHTSKALRVLRDKIAPELQPLCVSILGDDQESRRQLEGAVFHITQRLGEGADIYEEKVQTLSQRRRQLLEDLAKKRQQLIEAIGGEYREVVVLGKGLEPSEAARLVRKYQDEGLDWIPGKILQDAPLPLSQEELKELYKTNLQLDPAAEAELQLGLLPLESLPEPSFLEEWSSLRQAAQTNHGRLWKKEPILNDLEALIQNLEQALSPLQNMEPWQHPIVLAGRDTEEQAIWQQLINKIKDTQTIARQDLELSIQIHHDISLPDNPLDEQARLAGEIAQYLRQGGRLTWLTIRPRWRAYLQKVRIGSEKPQTYQHFRAIELRAKLLDKRRQLTRAWDLLIGKVGGPRLDSSEPEKSAAQFLAAIEEKLCWYSHHFEPFQQQLTETGLGLLHTSAYHPKGSDPSAELADLKGALEELYAILQDEKARVLFVEAERRINQALSGIDPGHSRLRASLAQSLEKREPIGYAQAYAALKHLWGQIPIWERRKALLERLRRLAPDWASAIEQREGLHGHPEPPAKPQEAWECRLFSQELEARSKVSINRLQAEIEKLEETLRQVSAELIEAKTWSLQIPRINLSQRQALIGWLNTVKRIGKGSGKRANELKKEATKQMVQCRSAVPVWIMPLHRVVEQFRPDQDLFDVIIIDEASQTDLFGLILFTMARSIVVVGDKEQVSPLAVGENLETVTNFLPLLDGIPNASLYDGKRSIYDIAAESFGGQVMLREHFRSVPEIIQFSNMLCYSGRINPLRESTSSNLQPAVKAVRVKGYRQGKTNPEEARFIVEQIKRCIQDSLYADKTFGVISMVGEEQALQIDRLLRQEISPAEIEKRQLLCGNPAQFQGDERDVIFLSLVDVPEEGPLRLRDNELWRQRFNVAASRARDQMWVVYSLDPAVDLKPGDLRRALIEHALEPERLVKQLKIEGAKTQSPFEKEVLEHLVQAGYQVKAQWPVGSYRIDLVVEGKNGRIAIECDGDRYHPPEKWLEDLERQRVLERLGWQFIRIRGSSYYRDPVSTINWLINELKKLDITPLTSSESTTSSTVYTAPSSTQAMSLSKGMEVGNNWNNPPINLGLDDIRSVTAPLPTKALGDSSYGFPTNASFDSSSEFQSIDDARRDLPNLTIQEEELSLSSKQDAVAPEEQDRIRQILATNPELWFEIARWAKKQDYFTAWERRFVYSLGIWVKKGKISPKQAKHAIRLLEQAQQLGFKSSQN